MSFFSKNNIKYILFLVLIVVITSFMMQDTPTNMTSENTEQKTNVKADSVSGNDEGLVLYSVLILLVLLNITITVLLYLRHTKTKGNNADVTKLTEICNQILAEVKKEKPDKKDLLSGKIHENTRAILNILENKKSNKQNNQSHRGNTNTNNQKTKDMELNFDFYAASATDDGTFDKAGISTELRPHESMYGFVYSDANKSRAEFTLLLDNPRNHEIAISGYARYLDPVCKYPVYNKKANRIEIQKDNNGQLKLGTVVKTGENWKVEKPLYVEMI